VTDRPGRLAVDAGLLARFREAGAKIAWRPAPKGAGRPAGRRARIAHLHDEEARVEEWGRGARAGVAVDSGPLGALVVVLAADRRGAPDALGAREAGGDPAFSAGAIVAGWGGEPVPTDARPRLADLVELARYALA
jgi:hypothetical protein